MASESSEEPKVKGILKKGDEIGHKKAGHLKIAEEETPAPSKHTKKEFYLIETSTGFLKKDANGNIIEDRREKPKGERQQLKPRSTSGDSISAAPSNDIIQPSDTIGQSRDTIGQPSDTISQQPQPVSQPPKEPAATKSPSKHEAAESEEKDKEKCILS